MNAPDHGHVERFSVNLTERTVRSMSVAQQIAEEPKTQVVNKSVQLYAYVLKTVADGGEVFVRLPGEDAPRQLLVLEAMQRPRLATDPE